MHEYHLTDGAIDTYVIDDITKVRRDSSRSTLGLLSINASATSLPVDCNGSECGRGKRQGRDMGDVGDREEGETDSRCRRDCYWCTQGRNVSSLN